MATDKFLGTLEPSTVCAASDNDIPVTGNVSREIVRDLDAVAGCRTCTRDRKAITFWHCE